jgi:hypothetical protein
VAGTLADRIVQIDKQNVLDYKIRSINDPRVNFNTRIVGYKVQTKSADSVTVAVWGTTSFGLYDTTDTKLIPRERWGSDVCSVQWSSEDWKIVNAQDGPGGPSITEREAEGYQRFVYVEGLAS